MKIFFTVVALLFLCSPSNAQRALSNFSQTTNQSYQSFGLRNVVDTIIPISFIPVNQGGLGCFTGVYSSDSGYVTGNNAYGDFEKAQFYDLAKMGYASAGGIQSVLIKFSNKTQNAAPEDVVVKIYSVDTSGFEPFNVLGISQPLNLSSIPINGDYAAFVFDAVVQVSDSFFVSIELPRVAGDTLVVLSTQDGCVENSGWAWEQWGDNSWHSILYSWIRDIDLAIFPVVDLPFDNGLTHLTEDNRLAVYPNPAIDFVTVKLPSNNASQVSIRILKPGGEIVQQFYSSTNPIENSVLIPLDGLAPSLYFLEVTSNENRWVTKMNVTK